MKEITEYINKWLIILDEMKNDNTYKLAWGRAIIEICLEKDLTNIDADITINFKEIGKKMLKYYWNQIFYFDLKQASNNINNKQPEIVKFTKELINDYKNIYQTTKPEWFNRVFPNNNVFLNSKFDRIIEKKIPVTLKSNVSWRFARVRNISDIGVYKLDLQNKNIILKYNEVIQLKDFGRILIQLFNYKWALLLEKYNLSPKIVNKVRGSGYENIKRSSLEPYKKILLLQYCEEQPRDFYTNELLSNSDVSIDHVIPWSFIYDDDIWNLVITSKLNNSKKNNSFVSEDFIEKLIKRNQKLIELLNKQQNKKYKKYVYDLKYSIENNIVRELYNYFR